MRTPPQSHSWKHLKDPPRLTLQSNCVAKILVLLSPKLFTCGESSPFKLVLYSSGSPLILPLHKTSPIEGLSTPKSTKHFSAVSPNFLRESYLTIPTRVASIIWSNGPLFCHFIAHSAKFTISLGRDGSITGLAQRTSNKTTPNEYTSDFSCCLLKYSGSRYPKLPSTAVLT